jgi:hypothetical protein
MSLDRNALPTREGFFIERQGLKLEGREGDEWRTGPCPQHGGTDSVRYKRTGAFVCMASCGFKGGDVLAAEMLLTGADFVTACKDLGAWVDDGKPAAQHKPTPLSPRLALQVLATEANLAAIAAGNVARGVVMSDMDLARLMTASNRITRLVEAFA